AGPRYFETMQTPIDYGREFTELDRADAEKTAIVNETFVRKIFKDVHSPAEALGKRISFDGSSGPWVKIVGVAGDGKYFNIAEEPRMFVWTPTTQGYWSNQILVVRTVGAPEATIGAVREAVRSLDPNLPLFDVKTFTEHMRFSLFPVKIAATV